MARRRRFDESKVRRWPAKTPDSRGGEFAPKASAPRWALALAQRLVKEPAAAKGSGRSVKTVRRRGGAAGGPAPDREPDLFGGDERRFRGEPTRRAPRERYEQTQLMDTSGGRQRPGQMSMLDELGNIDTTSSAGPAGGDLARLDAKVETLRGRLAQAREQRKRGARSGLRSKTELRLEEQLRQARIERDAAARQRPRTGIGPGGDDRGTGTGPFAFPRGSEGWNLRYAAGLSTGMDAHQAATYADSGLTYDQFKALGLGAGTGRRIVKDTHQLLPGDVVYGKAGPDGELVPAARRMLPAEGARVTAVDRSGHPVRIDTTAGPVYYESGAKLVVSPSPDAPPDVARTDAYESAVRTLDASSISERGREFAMRKLGALPLGVSAYDVGEALREGIGRSGHTKADNAILETIAASLQRPRKEPPRFDPNTQPPGFVEPPHPDSSRDPKVLFEQVRDYAQALADLRRPDGAGYFRQLPELTAVNKLNEGGDPADVVRALEAQANDWPEEWAGGREFLNRVAGFLRLQSTTLPKAQAEENKVRRARYRGVFEAAGGDRYWDLSTRTGAGTISDALQRLEYGHDPHEVARDMRATAQSLENRASAGHLQDYDLNSTLAYDPDSRKRMGLSDAKRLRHLANELEESETDGREGAVVYTAEDRKAKVAEYGKLSRADFDALSEGQRDNIITALSHIAASGDKKRAFRDSMGSLVRGADADHVMQARELRRRFTDPIRPTREQEFDALVERLKAGQGDIPVGLSRAELVKLDEALGLGESTSGRPTADKLRKRMQAALMRQIQERLATGRLTMPELAAKLKAAETNEEIGQLFPGGLRRAQLVELAEAVGMPVAGRPNAKQLESLLRSWVAIRPMGMFSTDPNIRRKAQRLLDDQRKITDENDRVSAARRRQALIDDAKRWGDLAAEYAELLDAQASDDALKRRLRADTKRLGLDPFEVGAIVNEVDSGRRFEAQRKLAALLKANGVELDGEAGAIVTLERRRYLGTDGSGLPADVTAVRIIRPSYTITLPDGEKVTVRGVAEPADVGPDFRIQQDILALKTAVAMRQFARDRGDKVPAYLKTKDQIREWLQMHYRYPAGMDFDEYSARIRVRPAKEAVPPAPTVRQRLLALSTDAERRAYLAGLDFKSQAEANRLAKALGARQTRISVDATLDNIVSYFAAAEPPKPERRRSSGGGFSRANAEDGDIVEWRASDGTTARGVVSVERRGKVTKVFVQWDGGRKEQIKTGEKYPDIHVVKGRVARDNEAIRRVMDRESPEGILDQVKEAASKEAADRILRRVVPHRLFLVAAAAGIRVGENDTSDQVRAAIVREWAGNRRGRGTLNDMPDGNDEDLSKLRVAQLREMARRLVGHSVPVSRMDKKSLIGVIQMNRSRREGGGERPFVARPPALSFNDEAELRWLTSVGQYDPNRAHRHIASVEKRVQGNIAKLEPLVAAGYVRKDSKGRYHPTEEAHKALAAVHQARLDAEAALVGKPVTPTRADDHFIRGGQAHRVDLARRVIGAAQADPDWNEFYGGEEQVRGDMFGNYLAAEQGFDGPPHVVTSDEFAEMRRRGEFRTVLFRGVGGGSKAMPAEEVHREWRAGRYRHGLGTFGNGTYMAVRRAHAAEYGEVAQFGLRKTARVITWDMLLKEMEQWSRRVRAKDNYDEDPEWNLYGDPGRYAMARGYDAIFVPKGSKPGLGREAGGDQYVILNRTAMVSAVPPVVDNTEEALKKLTRAELATRAENMLGGDTSVQDWSKTDLIAIILKLAKQREPR